MSPVILGKNTSSEVSEGRYHVLNDLVTRNQCVLYGDSMGDIRSPVPPAHRYLCVVMLLSMFIIVYVHVVDVHCFLTRFLRIFLIILHYKHSLLVSITLL